MTADPRPVVGLRGRLGNNLFQFALARRLAAPGNPAAVYGRPQMVDRLRTAVRSSSFEVATSREMLRLHRLTLPERVASAAASSVLDTVESTAARGRLGSWLSGCTRFEHGRSDRLRPLGAQPFDSSILHAHGSLFLDGFFQSERYFADIAELVVSDLVPPSESVGRFQGDRECIAVVIRAGADFEHLGWTVPIQWYLTALEACADVSGLEKVLVFSDIPTVAELFAIHIGGRFDATAATGFSVSDQLWLIGRCEGVVIGPSTFAWWGAWLGDAIRAFSDRVVVAPDPWIRPGLDVIPARWRTMQVKPEEAFVD